MRSIAEIGELVENDEANEPVPVEVAALLKLGEETLEHWLDAHDVAPTEGKKEGFRLLALHHQGAKLDPSFNACRETCRELVFYYNLISMAPGHRDTAERVMLMRYVSRHLFYFITGKMQNAKLGEFCCASKTVRMADAS